MFKNITTISNLAMKNLFSITLFLLLYNSGFAQNWNLIHENYKANYKTATDAFINTTVWVETTEIDGATTTYNLNRIVKTCDSCSSVGIRHIRGQAQFLGKQIIHDDDKYIFGNNSSLVLFLNKNIGEQWIYDTPNDITAQISNIEEQLIFEQLDSVITIQLSNGKRLKVAKHFGIIEFPKTDGEVYELVGIDNENLGETIPNFSDIFSFDIGDVFEYREWDADIGGSVENRYKKTILSKRVSGDSLIYETSIIGYKRTYDSGVVNFSNYSNIEEEYYVDSINHPANSYNNTLGTFSIFQDEEEDWILKRFFHDENNVFSKQLGLGEEVPDFDYSSLFTVDYNTDTLYPSPFQIHHKQVYKEGLGETFYILDFLVGGASGKKLLGYIKGQDTIGMITPDSQLIVSKLELSKNLTVDIFPNPATHQLFIRFNDLANNDNYIELLNVSGQVIYRKQLEENMNRIDVSHIPKGIYFAKIISDQFFTSKKVILH